MTRKRLFLIWLLCAAVLPLLLIAMLTQSLFGSEDRAKSMALAFDGCGNGLFGGDWRMSISERTGNGLLAGESWAKIVAPCIDLVFGKGHCLANATKGKQ